MLSDYVAQLANEPVFKYSCQNRPISTFQWEIFRLRVLGICSTFIIIFYFSMNFCFIRCSNSKTRRSTKSLQATTKLLLLYGIRSIGFVKFFLIDVVLLNLIAINYHSFLYSTRSLRMWIKHALHTSVSHKSVPLLIPNNLVEVWQNCSSVDRIE